MCVQIEVYRAAAWEPMLKLDKDLSVSQVWGRLAVRAGAATVQRVQVQEFNDRDRA